VRPLPPEIAAWAEPLGTLAPDLQPALVAWLRRVDAALGSLGMGQAHQDGEPDGYDGLTHRGPYQRLLPSQWLLADEYPDEFLRRAAMGEHMFFKSARRNPEAERAVVVLLDAGPEQVGAPRIAQLAALVVLARRAARSNARLLWGHLHAEPALREGLDGDLVRLWMGGHTRQCPDETQAERWQRWLDSTLERSNRWLLGAPRLAELASLRGFHQVAFESPLFAETESVHLSSRAAGTRVWSRPIVLPLIEQPRLVRLLRDPFPEKAAPVRRGAALAIGGGLDLSEDGRFVTVRGADGGAVSWPIPNSPNATAGRARGFRPDSSYHILAVTRAGKRLLAVALRGSTLCFFGVGSQQAKTGHGLFRRPAERELLTTLGLDGPGTLDDVGLCRLVVHRNGHGVGMLMLAPSGAVLMLVPTDKGFSVRTGPSALQLASAQTGHGYLYARRAPSGHVEVVDTVNGVLVSVVAPYTGEGRTFLGGTTVAVEQEPGAFRLASGPTQQLGVLHAPTGTEVVGTVMGGLLCVEAGGTQLSWLSRSNAKVLATTRGRIRQVRVTFRKSVVALTTDAGELLVVTPDQPTPLLHMRSQEKR